MVAKLDAVMEDLDADIKQETASAELDTVLEELEAETRQPIVPAPAPEAPAAAAETPEITPEKQAELIDLANSAATYGEIAKLKELKAQGVDLSAFDGNGYSPATSAARHNNIDVLRYLHDEAKVDLSVSHADGNSPVVEALQQSRVDVLRYLRDEAKVDLSAFSYYGYNPATIAANNGEVYVLKYLDEIGIDVLAKDKNGNTAIDLAKAKSHTKCSEFLLEVQAKRAVEKAPTPAVVETPVEQTPPEAPAPKPTYQPKNQALYNEVLNFKGDNLDLVFRGLTRQDAIDVANALEKNPTITTLNISSNNIGAVGASALAASKNNVTNLNIAWNEIGDDGAFALVANKNITTLNVSGNNIGDDGIEALARSETIINFEAFDNKFGDAGKEALTAREERLKVSSEPPAVAANAPAPVVEAPTLAVVESPPATSFEWDKAQNNGSLSYLKKGSEQREQTKFLQENLQAVGLAADIPESQFGHYGPKTSAAAIELQKAFKEAGAVIKVDSGNVYVQGWAALAALKETDTKLVDGKIPDDKKQVVLASYNEKLGESGQLVLGSPENSNTAFAATHLQLVSGKERDLV